MKIPTEHTLTIKKVAEKSAVGIETIRFYERKGLIEPAQRSPAGYRLFGENTIKRVRFIKRAQVLGFSLLEIRDLLSLYQNAPNARQKIYQKTVEKIDLVSEKINALQQIKHVLLSLVECCKGEGPIETCPIIDAFESEPPLDKEGSCQ
jgi:MerR family copper efflux transcriptional regulator